MVYVVCCVFKHEEKLQMSVVVAVKEGNRIWLGARPNRMVHAGNYSLERGCA